MTSWAMSSVKLLDPQATAIPTHSFREHSALLPRSAASQQEPEIREGFEGIIGESRPMERVFALARRVAPTDGTVLLTGETGTGKEVFVRVIHRLSRRNECPLLACDCIALAPTFLESELFGHVKGSFSGAIAAKQGLFEAAGHLVPRRSGYLCPAGMISPGRKFQIRNCSDGSQYHL